jgi:hypothetical protein
VTKRLKAIASIDLPDDVTDQEVEDLIRAAQNYVADTLHNVAHSHLNFGITRDASKWLFTTNCVASVDTRPSLGK